MFRTGNLIRILLLCMSLCLFAGCAAQDYSRRSDTFSGTAAVEDSKMAGVQEQQMQVAAPHAPAAKPMGSSAGDSGTDKSTQLTKISDSTPDRYLIKNATLTLECRDVRAATGMLIGSAKEIKGYVSDLHETVDALGARTVALQIRVPYSYFDTFLTKFEPLGKVLDRQVNAQDVTEEFVDTQSKLHNLKATEVRLLAHLGRTGNLNDTLLVEKEINRVREEIDSLTGRLRFLSHRVEYSTLTITLRETARPQAMTPPESFSVGKIFSDAMRSLVGFGQGVLTLAIWGALWSIVWIPAALIVFAAQQRGRRKP